MVPAWMNGSLPPKYLHALHCDLDDGASTIIGCSPATIFDSRQLLAVRPCCFCSVRNAKKKGSRTHTATACGPEAAGRSQVSLEDMCRYSNPTRQSSRAPLPQPTYKAQIHTSSRAGSKRRANAAVEINRSCTNKRKTNGQMHNRPGRIAVHARDLTASCDLSSRS